MKHLISRPNIKQENHSMTQNSTNLVCLKSIGQVETALYNQKNLRRSILTFGARPYKILFMTPANELCHCIS